ncbi:phage tail protein [Solidesulfovibrio carbinolicus]|uniref:Phage tail collar domain-containing protein n=1 Tax=Solidesulfovibrio carbinolicus TaxID=296842 RepID=A0A4P6HN64_9BACT|nr:phage tail protein [Solidesulfovibrio carbinolicus]QAZ67460.1 hypothetical protein C3Y92_09585 [Solidesulfovibrio carbinolicus]
MPRIIATLAVLLSIVAAIPAFAQSQYQQNPLQIGVIIHSTDPRMLPGGMEGWLLCDGRPVPAEFPELIAIIGETLPNLPAIDMTAYGGSGLSYAYINATPLIPLAQKQSNT